MDAALDYSSRGFKADSGDKEKLPPRILELRVKIHDNTYLDNAINRIAYILSKNLVDNPDELQLNLD